MAQIRLYWTQLLVFIPLLWQLLVFILQECRHQAGLIRNNEWRGRANEHAGQPGVDAA